MKKLMLLLLGIGIFLSAVAQQETVVITGPELVSDAVVSSRYPDKNMQSHKDFIALAWTNGGAPDTYRSLINFDLSAIPSGATILEAKMALFYNPTTVNGQGTHSSLSGSNESVLSRITEDWSDASVTWNTEPSTTSQNEVILEKSTSPTQDYILDVKNIVQDMIDNPDSSYGFRLKLVTESYYRCLIFASTDNPDVSLWPKLTITYSIAEEKQAPISNVRKISALEGGMENLLNAGDRFGASTAIGDLDGDGIEDLAVGASETNDGGSENGAVWILLMNTDRSIKAYQKISQTSGNFFEDLSGSRFGISVASLGDLDGDKVPDIAVGAYYDNDGGYHSGAIWILFLNSDGTVKKSQKISGTKGGLTGLTANRNFGTNCTSLGDINQDGYLDLAVGVPQYDADGGLYKGSIWMLSIDKDGMVKDQFIISEGRSGFNETINSNDLFGKNVQNVGDINHDGINDLFASREGNDDGGSNTGAFYILFLNSDKTVKESHKVSATTGNFNGSINAGDLFGNSCTSLGDIDADGINDLLVSCDRSDDGGTNIGKAYIIYMNQDGTVKDQQVINSENEAMIGRLDTEDWFGHSMSCFSGLNDNGHMEIVISALNDGDGGTRTGAIYIIDLEITPTKQAPISNVWKISATQGGFTGTLHSGDHFSSICLVGDVDNDGIDDLAIGAFDDADGGELSGAVWILFMNSDGTVKSQQKISSLEGNFSGNIIGSRFGNYVESMGDFNNDGIPDIAVGAYYDGHPSYNAGAVWLIFLNTDGTVKDYQKIGVNEGGLQGLTINRWFGASIANLGDVNNDGLVDVAVGVPNYDADGGHYKGSIWMLSLNSEGNVVSQFIISEGRGGFTGTTNSDDRFGRIVTNLGDIDGDGIVDLGVSVEGDDDGGSDYGAMYILFLNSDKTVKSYQKISATQGNFSGNIASGDMFGTFQRCLGDIDSDGNKDLLVSAHKSDNGGTSIGEVFVLYLNNDGTVKDYQTIDYLNEAFNGELEAGYSFGYTLGVYDGYSSNGGKTILTGASSADDGFTDAGAVYLMNIDVKHKPMAEAGENIEVCAGNSFSVDGSGSSVLDNDSLEYLWTSSNYELTDSTKPVLDFPAPDTDEITNYEFVLNVTCDGIKADPDTTIVTVYPVGGKPEIVQEGYELTASVNATEYEWYLNGEVEADQTKQTISVIENGYYQVKAFNELGCSGELSDSLMVMVHPVALASAESEICSGETIDLDASKSEKLDDSEMTYHWTSDILQLEDSTSMKVSVQTPGFDVDTTIEFYLTVEQNGIVSRPDTVFVVVHPSPSKPVIKVDDNNLSIDDEGLDVQWYANGDYIQNAVEDRYTANYNGYFQVQTTNEYGCSSEMSDSVEVLMVPTAKAYGSKKVCSNTMMYLDGSESTSAISGDLSYHWFCNLMEVPDSNLVDPSFIIPTVQVVTEYEFYLKVSQNDIDSPIDTFLVTVSPAPTQPEIQQFADTLMATEATAYQWFLNGDEVNGATNKTYVVNESGLYYVKVANEYGCVSDPSNELNVFKTSRDGISYELQIYPNPTSGQFTILGLPQDRPVKIQLINEAGQQVWSTLSMDGKLDADISSVPYGVYLLMINNDRQRTFKLIKQ